MIHALMRSPHGVEMHAVMGVGGGSPCHGLVERSVSVRGSAVGQVLGNCSWAYGLRVSR